MSEHLRSAEDVAREAMGNITGPMRRIFRGSEHAEWLDALDVLIAQEVEHLADLIRARDAEVRADERAKVRGRDAALRAWTNAGPRPDVHHKAKDVVRKTMPVLARALDEGERGLT